MTTEKTAEAALDKAYAALGKAYADEMKAEAAYWAAKADVVKASEGDVK